MKEISLTQGKVALVDDDDYGELSKHKWHFVRIKGTDKGYASRWKCMYRPGHRKKFVVRMQNAIMRPPSNMTVDHVDGDGLNNQLSNLRLATKTQQAQNRTVTNGRQYKGVVASPSSEEIRWTAQIKVSGKLIFLGTYASERDAAIAYNAAALVSFREFARINKI